MQGVQALPSIWDGELSLLDGSQLFYKANSAKREGRGCVEASHEAKVLFHSDPGTSIDLLSLLLFILFFLVQDAWRLAQVSHSPVGVPIAFHPLSFQLWEA